MLDDGRVLIYQQIYPRSTSLMRVYAGLQVTVTHPELSLFAIHNAHGYTGVLLSAEPNLFITAIRGYAKAIHLVSFLYKCIH